MSESRRVDSPQDGIHKDLDTIVVKHMTTEYKRPIQDHTKRAFERVLEQAKELGERPIILDSACGVGMSSFKLGAVHSDSIVIGIDKSQDRILKSDWYAVNVARASGSTLDNVIIERADVIDFWRLLVEANVAIEKHFILYPNPWPKQSSFKKRWQGHPIFPILCNVCNTIELRSNWKLYLEEFNRAYAVAKLNTGIIEQLSPEVECLTAFEKKYGESGQDLWKLLITPK
ncbi:MAG: tRNA (guanine-N(7)-)-methyltransferase [Fibrobacterales bacterium]